MSQELTPGFTIETQGATETLPEVAQIENEKMDKSAQTVAAPPSKPAALPITAQEQSHPTDAVRKEIEDLLVAGFTDLYKQLEPAKKSVFKQRGEEIAAQITHILASGVMNIKKILKLIRSWLEIIPGINKFFLEKEAKIKTDKIQQLFDRQHSPAAV